MSDLSHLGVFSEEQRAEALVVVDLGSGHEAKSHYLGLAALLIELHVDLVDGARLVLLARLVDLLAELHLKGSQHRPNRVHCLPVASLVK